MKKCFILLTIILSVHLLLSAQQNNGVIRGRVFNSKTNEGSGYESHGGTYACSLIPIYISYPTCEYADQ